MNKLIRKITTICMAFVLMMSLAAVDVRADEPVVTYGVEYGENSATVTFYTTIIDAFDIAVAYDISKLTVSDCGYTMDFKKLQVGGENTTISVKNEDAKDNVGNTYVVFTGAGANMSTQGGIEFAGKPLCYVTFEGELTGSDITIVTDSATADNIYDANVLGKLTLDANTKPAITPEPIDDVVYISPEPTNDTSDGQDAASVSGNESSQNSSNDVGNTSVSTDVPETSATEDVNDNSESDGGNVEVEKTEDVSETQKDISNENTDDGSAISPVILGILIVVALVLMAAIIVVVIRKRKK